MLWSLCYLRRKGCPGFDGFVIERGSNQRNERNTPNAMIGFGKLSRLRAVIGLDPVNFKELRDRDGVSVPEQIACEKRTR
jgi:hypothetical protein